VWVVMSWREPPGALRIETLTVAFWAGVRPTDEQIRFCSCAERNGFEQLMLSGTVKTPVGDRRMSDLSCMNIISP
jgi:hypothetical protein